MLIFGRPRLGQTCHANSTELFSFRDGIRAREIVTRLVVPLSEIESHRARANIRISLVNEAKGLIVRNDTRDKYTQSRANAPRMMVDSRVARISRDFERTFSRRSPERVSHQRAWRSSAAGLTRAGKKMLVH